MHESWELFLPKWLTRLAHAFRDVAGVIMIAMMLLTVIDIVSRSIGFGSIESVIEISSLSVVLIVFFGLASCTAVGGHILIDLFTRNNKRETNQIIDAFWLIVMALILVLLAWYGMEEALIAHGTGERTEVLRLSPLAITGPAVAAMILSIAIATGIGISVYRHFFKDTLSTVNENHTPDD